MARDWNALFESWRKPPSETEQEKAEAVRAAITKSIKGSPRFEHLHPRLDLHGSYGNNTNVRLNSDIDVAVVVTDYCVADYSQAPDLDNSKVGLTTVDYSLSQARHDVQDALTKQFGADRVNGKNKAIHVKESSSHLEADVIACFERRRYRPDKSYHSGICFKPLVGELIENWPAQNRENANRKADQTGRRYKKVVRILKRLTQGMQENGIAVASKIPSCLIEALCYNVPETTYGNESIRRDVREVVAQIYHRVKDGRADKWVELNELLYLFHKGQKWNKDDVVAWAQAAWDHAELHNA